MNPYEAPQTVDRVVKETPPKRKLSWRDILLFVAVSTAVNFVMHYYREQEREQKQAEMMQQMMQQLKSSFPANP